MQRFLVRVEQNVVGGFVFSPPREGEGAGDGIPVGMSVRRKEQEEIEMKSSESCDASK